MVRNDLPLPAVVLIVINTLYPSVLHSAVLLVPVAIYLGGQKKVQQGDIMSLALVSDNTDS